MDAILGLIGIVVVVVIYNVVISLFFSGVRAAGRAVKKVVTGKETYFGTAQLKLVDDKLKESDLLIKRIMLRGAIPCSREMKVSFQISAFDVTEGDDDPKHVVSIIDQTQEADTICFAVSDDLGKVEPGDTFTDWIQIGVIVPEFLQTAKSGLRTIHVYLRMFDSSDPPTISGGFGNGDGEVILAQGIKFDYLFEDKGYEEVSQDREEAQTLTLQIGVAVAMADGNLEDAEGELLKSWMLKQVSVFSEERQKRLKSLFNDTLKEAFVKAESGTLALTPLVERLSEIGEKKSKYDAVELCFEVMAADGNAAPEEMNVIRRVAESLDLDMAEIEAMREGVTLNLTAGLSSESDLESLVGLEEGWSDEQKKKHLRLEFQKWSNRMNALAEGDERDAAQSMLDSIARLRKKYG